MKVIIDNNIPSHADQDGVSEILAAIANTDGISFCITPLNFVEAAFTENEDVRGGLANWYNSFPFKCELVDPTTLGLKEVQNGELDFSGLTVSGGYLSSNKLGSLIASGKDDPRIETLYRQRLFTPIYILRLRENPGELATDLDRLEKLFNTGELVNRTGEREKIASYYHDLTTEDLIAELERLIEADPTPMKKDSYAKFKKYRDIYTLGHTMPGLEAQKPAGEDLDAFIERLKEHDVYEIRSFYIALKFLEDVLWIEGEGKPSVRKKIGKRGTGVAIDIDYSAYIPYVDYFITDDRYLREDLFNSYFEDSKAISMAQFIEKFSI